MPTYLSIQNTKNVYRKIDMNIDKLVGKFNSLLKDKILTICNEVKNYGSGHSECDRVKTLITDEMQTVELKGIDSTENIDYLNWVICTNNDFQ
jgi:hypothetical protein